MQHNASSTKTSRSRRACTIVELMFSLMMALLLMAVCLPNLLHSREIARRTQCATNLTEIGAALWGYHSVHSRFPLQFNANADIYPHLSSAPPITKRGFKNNLIIGEGPSPRVLRCPTDPDTYVVDTALSYCWNTGPGLSRRLDQQSGGFMSDVALSPTDIVDGASYTAAASETRMLDWDPDRIRRKAWRVDQFYPNSKDWHRLRDDCLNVPQDKQHFSSGQERGTKWNDDLTYDHTLPPNRPSCESSGEINGTNTTFEIWTANSEHPGGVYLLLVDGSVRFISDTIDADLWSALSTRAGSEKIEW